MSDKAELLRIAPDDWRDPKWDEPQLVYNWRIYATPELRAIWHTFTDEQALVVCVALDAMASGEDWE